MKCKFCATTSQDSNLWLSAHLKTGKIHACPKCYPKMEKYLFDLKREHAPRRGSSPKNQEPTSCKK